MNKVLIAIIFLSESLLSSTRLNYSSEEEYNYGFILSCNRTEYYSSPIQLSPERLLQILDELETRFCGEGQSSEETTVN